MRAASMESTALLRYMYWEFDKEKTVTMTGARPEEKVPVSIKHVCWWANYRTGVVSSLTGDADNGHSDEYDVQHHNDRVRNHV
jgi:hypothetical protein